MSTDSPSARTRTWSSSLCASLASPSRSDCSGGKSAPFRAPKKCDYSIYAKAAVQIEGWDPSRASVTQEYFVPGATPADAGTWATGSPSFPGCSADEPTDLLVQRVTIRITSPDGKVTRAIEVVKSDV